MNIMGNNSIKIISVFLFMLIILCLDLMWINFLIMLPLFFFLSFFFSNFILFLIFT